MLYLHENTSIEKIKRHVDDNPYVGNILAMSIPVSNEILNLLCNYLLSKKINFHSICLFSCYSSQKVQTLNIRTLSMVCSEAMTVNLSGNYLNDEHVFYLCNVLKTNKNLKYLHVSMNDITIKSVEYIFDLCRIRKEINLVDLFCSYEDGRPDYLDSVKDIYRHYYLNLKYLGSNATLYPRQTDIDKIIKKEESEFKQQYPKKLCVYTNYMNTDEYSDSPIFNMFSSTIFDVNLMNLVFEFEYSFS